MEPSHDRPEETLQMMADALGAPAHAADTGEKRRELRRPMSAECEVWFFYDLGLRTTTTAGEIRNISFRGMSVVAHIPAPIRVGRPLEVVVSVPGMQQKHVAGTTAFCRKINSGAYEFGIEVKAAGSAPILMRDTTAAQIIYEWFAKALKVPE